MPRPKGCTCGTPKPCRVHAPGEPPGGRSQDGAADGVVADAAPFLRVIEDGGGEPLPGLKAEAGVPLSSASKRKPDPTPKPRRERKRKPVAPDKPDDAALQQMLSELLVMPAIPAAMMLDCAYCRDHFIAEGPKAARELVALSLVNPALRGALESLHAGWTKLTIAGVLAGYLAKPMMHHLAPEPVLTAAGPVLGVPPRPPKPKPHTHAADPQAEYNGQDPEAPEDQYSGAEAA